MKLQDQVTNLEISKRLKELGVKQESLFLWYKHTSFPDTAPKVVLWDDRIDKPSKIVIASAFTVAELGEMLKEYKKDGLYAGINSCSILGDWEKNNHGGSSRDYIYLDDKYKTTEADARGKMLIYLLENKLI